MTNVLSIIYKVKIPPLNKVSVNFFRKFHSFYNFFSKISIRIFENFISIISCFTLENRETIFCDLLLFITFCKAPFISSYSVFKCQIMEGHANIPKILTMSKANQSDSLFQIQFLFQKRGISHSFSHTFLLITLFFQNYLFK